MNFRRLSPVDDEVLLHEAYLWDADAPAWYSAGDALFRPDSVEQYLAMAHDTNQVDIAVFNPDLCGLITFDHKGGGAFEIRLSAKRGTPLETLAYAGQQVRHQIFTIGAKIGVVWIAERNRHVIKLCEAIGFVRDGLTMYRGVYNRKVKRPIEWVRMVTTREQWMGEQV